MEKVDAKLQRFGVTFLLPDRKLNWYNAEGGNQLNLDDVKHLVRFVDERCNYLGVAEIAYRVGIDDKYCDVIALAVYSRLIHELEMYFISNQGLKSLVPDTSGVTVECMPEIFVDFIEDYSDSICKYLTLR